MTTRDSDTLKSYWTLGKVPTPSNYNDLVDTIFEKRIIGSVFAEHLNITDTSIQFKDGDEVYTELAGGSLALGSLTRDHILVGPSGIKLKEDTIVKIDLQGDGDVFIGEDVSVASTSFMSIFSNSQIYNGEAVSAGDVLLGDNSASKANILWDKSTGKLLFRGGTTTQAEVDTSGAIVGGAGNVIIDATGITVTAEGVGYGGDEYRYKVRNYIGTMLEMRAYEGSMGVPWFAYITATGMAVSHEIDLFLEADNGDIYIKPYLGGGKLTYIQSDTHISRDVRVGYGLYVGDTALSTDPGDGEIIAANRIYINDTVNGKSTIGLTINQGTDDDEILSLKSSDVAHGIIGLTETDTYGTLAKYNGNTGGLSLRGFSEDVVGLQLVGTSLNGTTTKDSTALGVIDITVDSGWRIVTPPSGWTWTLPFKIHERNGEFRPDPAFSLQDYALNQIAAGTIYYVSKTGSDSADGLSWGTALRNIYTAAGKSDARIIYIGAGYWYRNEGGGVAASRSCAYIGVGDVYWTVDCINQVGSFSLVNTHYEATCSRTPKNVHDGSILDAYGGESRLTLVADIATCNSTPGSWYLDDPGNMIYIHTADGRAPDTSIRYYEQGTPCQLYNSGAAFDRVSYYENIKFRGGWGCGIVYTANGGDVRMYVKDCDMRYASNGTSTYNAFSVWGATEAIFWNVTLAHSPLYDGFNYKLAGGITPRAIEYNCTVFDHGDDTIDQASTSHDGVRIVRIMGEYHHVMGRSIIADVGSASGKSWLLGCDIHSPKVSCSVGAIYADVGVDVWCDQVNIHDIVSGYDLTVDTTATILYHNITSGGSFNNGGGGISTYTVTYGSYGELLADENILSIRNYTTTLFLFDADGDFSAANHIFINDSLNVKSTIGLTINQGIATDESISLKNSNVAHGITDTTETDTYGFFAPVSADGGMRIRGISEVSEALNLYGLQTTGVTTKSTSAAAAITLSGGKKSGTAPAALGADENIVRITSHGGVKFIFDADGDMWYTGNLQGYRNSATYTGYIFVPLTTPFTNSSWNGDDTKTANTYVIDLTADFSSTLEGVKAVLVRLSGHFATPQYYAALRPRGGSGSAVRMLNQVANVDIELQAVVPTDTTNYDIEVVVSGGTMTEAILEIWGYWI